MADFSPWMPMLMPQDDQQLKLAALRQQDPSATFLLQDPLNPQKAQAQMPSDEISKSPKVASAPLRAISAAVTTKSYEPQLSPQEKEIQDQFDQLLKDRKGRIGQAEDEMKSLGDRPSGLMGMDLSPLAGLVDSWTGSKLAGSYKGPTAKMDYDKQKQILQAALDKERNGLSDDQLNLLKMKAQERSQIEAAKLRAEMMKSMGAQRAELGGARLADSQNKSFQNDKQLLKYTNSIDALGRVHSILTDPNIPITNQEMKEATDAVAQALTLGAQSTGSDREKKEFQTAYGKLQGYKQYFEAKPQEAVTPEIRQYFLNQIGRLQGSFGEQMINRAQTVGAARQYGIPVADKAVKANIEHYRQIGEDTKSAGNSNQKPKQVIQNGHTYILNEKTGQYE